MDKNTGRKKSKKKMLAKTKFCESLRVRNYERPTALVEVMTSILIFSSQKDYTVTLHFLDQRIFLGSDLI